MGVNQTTENIARASEVPRARSSEEISPLRDARLAAYTYTRLAPDDPRRAALRDEYLSALARHHDIKREIIPLLAAWRRAGIEALLFKGFHLAEFVYPVAGARFHGDVDLLIRPEQAGPAQRVARELGWWRVAGSHQSGWQGPMLFELYRPGGAASVDVHRWVVTPSRTDRRWHERMTEALWAGSTEQAWEGTVVRIPAAADAILIGLVLNRLKEWPFGFKAHDSVDLILLLERAGVSHEAVRRRAEALGIARTAELFFRACEATADPTGPSRLALVQRWRLRLTAFRECGLLALPRFVQRLQRAPLLTWDVIKVLPLALRVAWVLRRYADVRDVLAALTPAPTGRRSTWPTRYRTIRALRWAFILFPLAPAAGDCLPRSLAVYAALRRQRWPVRFASGVRHGPLGLEGHAWVEDEDGMVLPEQLSADQRKPEYQASVRYPAD